MQIDLTKLREAVKFIDKPVAETKLASKSGAALEEIDLDNISEKDYLKKAVELIGPVKKTPNKTLARDSFIKVFKYSGDFAKLRAKDVKQKAQEERMIHFCEDHKKYLAALQKTVSEEEKAFEQSSLMLFDELSISPEMFERSQ